MQLRWTVSAQRDLQRLYDFLAPKNKAAAHRVLRQLVAGAEQLRAYPQLGTQLEEFVPRHVRQLIVGEYELRYELTAIGIYVLHIWHSREDR